MSDSHCPILDYIGNNKEPRWYLFYATVNTAGTLLMSITRSIRGLMCIFYARHLCWKRIFIPMFWDKLWTL
jgi:hypothetical protein